MERRQMIALIGSVGLTGWVSGCSSTDDGANAAKSTTENKRTETAEGTCGPGEQTIREVATGLPEEPGTPQASVSTGTAEEETVHITGTIQSLDDNAIIIDDGTGRAKLTTLFGGFETENVGEGDCAAASGVPFAPEDDSDNDIRFLVEDVGLADGQRTDAG